MRGGIFATGIEKRFFSFNAWASEAPESPRFLGGMERKKGKSAAPESRELCNVKNVFTQLSSAGSFKWKNLIRKANFRRAMRVITFQEQKTGQKNRALNGMYLDLPDARELVEIMRYRLSAEVEIVLRENCYTPLLIQHDIDFISPVRQQMKQRRREERKIYNKNYKTQNIEEIKLFKSESIQ